MFKNVQTLRLALLSLFLGTVTVTSAESESHAEDWSSPRSIIHALHETVSADPGEARDWDRYRNLFLDGAMMSMAVKSARMPGIIAATPEELIEQTEANYAATGFHEIPLVVEITEYGAMAVAINSFEVKLRRDDPEPLMRGLNHTQFLHDGERWWIVSNVSTVESANWELPAAFDPDRSAENGQ